MAANQLYAEYRGVTITRVMGKWGETFDFVVNHAPYSVPYYEDAEFLIDMALGN